MSLVNDMLRDLDQRRHDSTQPKFGAERLVPVTSDHRNLKVNRSLVTFVLSIAITLALIVGGLYFWQSLTANEVQLNPNQPAFSPNTISEVVPNVEQRELEEISLRVRELEAQNRALLEAQSAIATQVNATQMQLDDESSQQLISDSSTQLVAEVERPASQVVASIAPVSEPYQAEKFQTAPSVEKVTKPIFEAPVSSGVIRSPRELSFAERDQLQVQEALRLASNNQNELAMQHLREFVSSNPNAHNSREAMIKLALQKGDTVTAEQLLQNGFSLDVNRPGYRKLQARMMLGAGQAEQAMQLLSSRIPLIQDDIEYHDILATAYLSMQNYEKAALSYEALVQQNRSEGRWWYGLASAWENLGRTRDAELAYQEALKLPNLSTALRQRSQQRVVELSL